MAFCLGLQSFFWHRIYETNNFKHKIWSIRSYSVPYGCNIWFMDSCARFVFCIIKWTKDIEQWFRIKIVQQYLPIWRNGNWKYKKHFCPQSVRNKNWVVQLYYNVIKKHLLDVKSLCWTFVKRETKMEKPIMSSLSLIYWISMKMIYSHGCAALLMIIIGQYIWVNVAANLLFVAVIRLFNLLGLMYIDERHVLTNW